MTHSASAQCGWPDEVVSRCTAKTTPVTVRAGRDATVSCSGDAGEDNVSIGVRTMRLDCGGRFTTTFGP